MPQPSDTKHATDTDDLLADATARPEDTDDLLASMADEAIDRMLGGVPAESVKSEASELPDLSDAEAAALADDLADDPEPVESADTAEPVASDDDTLDALFRGEDAAVPDRPPVVESDEKPFETPRAEAEEVSAAAAALAAELQADVDQSPHAQADVPVEAEGDEDLDALLAGSFEDAPAAEEDKSDAPAAAAATGVPIYLKPLVWMNRPLDRSPAARDLVGKIALLTLLNAGGLLVYVAVRG